MKRKNCWHAARRKRQRVTPSSSTQCRSPRRRDTCEPSHTARRWPSRSRLPLSPPASDEGGGWRAPPCAPPRHSSRPSARPVTAPSPSPTRDGGRAAGWTPPRGASSNPVIRPGPARWPRGGPSAHIACPSPRRAVAAQRARTRGGQREQGEQQTSGKITGPLTPAQGEKHTDLGREPGRSRLPSTALGVAP